jgi:hypothetical protein
MSNIGLKAIYLITFICEVKSILDAFSLVDKISKKETNTAEPVLNLKRIIGKYLFIKYYSKGSGLYFVLDLKY